MTSERQSSEEHTPRAPHLVFYQTEAFREERTVLFCCLNSQRSESTTSGSVGISLELELVGTNTTQ